MSMTDNSNPRSLPTGSIMSRFGPEEPTRYSPYAALPPELASLMEQLAKLEYPLTSKTDLLRKLGGHEAPLIIGQMTVEAGAATMFFPASIFPAATPENLAEKLAELYRQRAAIRPQTVVSADEIKELASRFTSENAKMIQLAALLVRWIVQEKVQTIEKDSDAFAARLLRENERLVAEVADAFASISTLRSKTGEAAREQAARGVSG